MESVDYRSDTGGADMEMYEEEAGPPTIEDDWWHHEHVRAAGYPKVKTGDRPMEGQVELFVPSDQGPGEWTYTPPEGDTDVSALQIDPWEPSIQETIDSEALRNTRYADKGQHYPFPFGGTCTCGARHTQEETDALNA